MLRGAEGRCCSGPLGPSAQSGALQWQALSALARFSSGAGCDFVWGSDFFPLVLSLLPLHPHKAPFSALYSLSLSLYLLVCLSENTLQLSPVTTALIPWWFPTDIFALLRLLLLVHLKSNSTFQIPFTPNPSKTNLLCPHPSVHQRSYGALVETPHKTLGPTLGLWTQTSGRGVFGKGYSNNILTRDLMNSQVGEPLVTLYYTCNFTLIICRWMSASCAISWTSQI